MAEFHDRLAAVFGEIWESGALGSDALDRKLGALAMADLPEGVLRLPTARMSAGPHLAAQAEAGQRGARSVVARREPAARRGLRAAH